MALEWIEVLGGVCEFGDDATPVSVPTLLWTRSPITHGNLCGDHPGTAAGLPLTRMSHAEATAVATRLSGRLPRSVEWEWMATGPARRRWPWGEQPWQPDLANLFDSGYARTSPVTAHARGATPEGLLDVAGNVWEWTASTTMGGGAIIRGGSYAASPLYAQCTFLNAAPVEWRSPGIGLRVVRTP